VKRQDRQDAPIDQARDFINDRSRDITTKQNRRVVVGDGGSRPLHLGNPSQRDRAPRVLSRGPNDRFATHARGQREQRPRERLNGKGNSFVESTNRLENDGWSRNSRDGWKRSRSLVQDEDEEFYSEDEDHPKRLRLRDGTAQYRNGSAQNRDYGLYARSSDRSDRPFQDSIRPRDGYSKPQVYARQPPPSDVWSVPARNPKDWILHDDRVGLDDVKRPTYNTGEDGSDDDVQIIEPEEDQVSRSSSVSRCSTCGEPISPSRSRSSSYDASSYRSSQSRSDVGSEGSAGSVSRSGSSAYSQSSGSYSE